MNEVYVVPQKLSIPSQAQTKPLGKVERSFSQILDSRLPFSKFLLNEWQNAQYYNILEEKILFVSYGGKCFQYQGNGEQSGSITTTSPSHLQGNHEEADTLIAFHIAQMAGRNIMVRASDTDVLVIRIGALGQQRREVRSTSNIIMDCGMGNSRRYINVTNITDNLEERQPRLSKALPGYHAFTGCDFTSAFYR